MDCAADGIARHRENMQPCALLHQLDAQAQRATLGMMEQNQSMICSNRPTGLGHGVYADAIDYNVFSGEWCHRPDI